MSQLLSRFTLRLLVPALALSTLALLADPLPAPAQSEADAAVKIELAVKAAPETFAAALQQEADALRQEADAAKKAARQTAAQMRWFLTLPAAGSKRCSSPTCAS